MKHASPWTSISYVLRGREVRLRASLVYIRGMVNHKCPIPCLTFLCVAYNLEVIHMCE
jgi:hypothetical protein